MILKEPAFCKRIILKEELALWVDNLGDITNVNIDQLCFYLRHDLSETGLITKYFDEWYPKYRRRKIGELFNELSTKEQKEILHQLENDTLKKAAVNVQSLTSRNLLLDICEFLQKREDDEAARSGQSAERPRHRAKRGLK